MMELSWSEAAFTVHAHINIV